MAHTALEYNKSYHIYNRGINGCPLFRHTDNYEHFLNLYDKYISPVANTFAWVLMNNHFHFLVRIKKEDEIYNSPNLQGYKNLEGLTNRSRITQQFSNLFNAYSKTFNKRYKRTGSLFEHPFRRIPVNSTAHLKYLVYYIHHNPVHHGFCEDMLEYPWSSYLTILSPKKTKLSRDEVLKWYNDQYDYKAYHSSESVDKFADIQIDLPFVTNKR